MSKKTEITNILKIDALFKRKNWVLREEYEDVYDRYCQLLRSFENEEVELILDLSERYLWISYNDYNAKLRILLKKLKSDFLGDLNFIHAFPIIKLSDENKNKSGHNVMYMLSGIKTTLVEYDDITYNQITRFNTFNTVNFTLNSNELIILVDDFIGTGTTLTSTIEQIKIENPNINNNNFIVLSIAIQNDTYTKLESSGIRCCVNYIIKKGISGHYDGDELLEKTAIMNRIEDFIPKIKGYRMGYKKSETLITLIKTPNNTFPVFWKNFTKRNVEFKAPFSRY